MKSSGQKSKFILTNREREVFELLVQDKTTKDIAQQLFISEKTVRNHISNAVWFEVLRLSMLPLGPSRVPGKSPIPFGGPVFFRRADFPRTVRGQSLFRIDNQFM